MIGDKELIHRFHKMMPGIIGFASAEAAYNSLNYFRRRAILRDLPVEGNQMEAAYRIACAEWITEHHAVNSVGGVTHGDAYAGRDNRCRICYPRPVGRPRKEE